MAESKIVPILACLQFHFRPRNQGKGGEGVGIVFPIKVMKLDNCLPLRFCGWFFFVHVPGIIRKLNNNKNCLSEQDADQVLYSAMDGQKCQNKEHGDTVPEKACNMLLCSLQINIKKARQMRFSTVGYVCSIQTRVIFNPAVSEQLYNFIVMNDLIFVGPERGSDQF